MSDGPYLISVRKSFDDGSRTSTFYLSRNSTNDGFIWVSFGWGIDLNGAIPNEMVWYNTYPSNQFYSIDETGQKWYLEGYNSDNQNTPKLTKDSSRSGNIVVLNSLPPLVLIEDKSSQKYLETSFDGNNFYPHPMQWTSDIQDQLIEKTDLSNLNNHPSSVASGLYQISVDNKCLRNDAQWDSCPDLDISPYNPMFLWRYDADNGTLETSTATTDDLYSGSKKYLFQNDDGSITTKTHYCVPWETKCQVYPFTPADDSKYKTFVLQTDGLYNKTKNLYYDESFHLKPITYKYANCKEDQDFPNPNGSAFKCDVVPSEGSTKWNNVAPFYKQAVDAENQMYGPLGSQYGPNRGIGIYDERGLWQFAMPGEKIVSIDKSHILPTSPQFNPTDGEALNNCCSGAAMGFRAMPVITLQVDWIALMKNMDTYPNLLRWVVKDGIDPTIFQKYPHLYYLDDPDGTVREVIHPNYIKNNESGVSVDTDKYIQCGVTCETSNGNCAGSATGKICTIFTKNISVASIPSTITLYTINENQRVIDARCNSEWYPWSHTCANESEVIKSYCSGIDSQGYPRINTDVNCKSWCSAVNLLGACGDAAGRFCTKYTGNYACVCQNVDDTAIYKQTLPYFEAMGKVDSGFIIPSGVCWAPQCSVTKDSPDSYLLDTKQRGIKQNCKTNIAICNQIINANTDGTINIDNNTFSQICGMNLPSPSPSPPSPPSPSPPSPPSPSPPIPSPSPSPSPPIPPQPPIPSNCSYQWTPWTNCINGRHTRSGILNENQPSTCKQTVLQTEACSSGGGGGGGGGLNKQTIIIIVSVIAFVLILGGLVYAFKK